MRKRLQGIVIGFVLAAVMLGGTALANFRNENITVTYRDIRLVINGQEVTPRDAFGNVVEPFIFEGTTFLPVRAVAEALGQPVDWDGVTSTVYIGATPHGAPLWATIPAFQGTGLGLGNVNMLGNPFANALRTNNTPVHSSATGWADRNLNAQFNTITGTIGRVDGSGSVQSVISFIGDGRELASFNIDADSHPTDISVDVRGVLVLRIQITQPRGGARIAFTNAMID